MIRKTAICIGKYLSSKLHGDEEHYEETSELYRDYEGDCDLNSSSGDHCGGSVFFSGAKSCICQQYLRSWNRAFKFHSAAVVGDHHDFERGASYHRLFYLWKGIWSENCLYKHHASGIFRCI